MPLMDGSTSFATAGCGSVPPRKVRQDSVDEAEVVRKE